MNTDMRYQRKGNTGSGHQHDNDTVVGRCDEPAHGPPQPATGRHRLEVFYLGMAFLAVTGGLGPTFAGSSAPAAEIASETNQPRALLERLEKLETRQQEVLKELAELRRALGQGSGMSALKAAPKRPSVIPLDVRGEPFRGQADARIAIVEYSDFACPYCAEYVREVYPRLETEYIKSGKVRYFFRDLPELGHTNALLAAQAAHCADEQGKFWEMHDLLFAAQPAFGGSELVTYAEGIGLDPAQFKACLASNRWTEAIRRSAAGARRMELYGTPAFLFGTVSEDGNVVQATKTIIGGASYDALKSALDGLLTSQSKVFAAQASRDF